ncbi:hypothetical protein [Streptomyces sp. 6-11-2]|uniref:hypothetical protein n=1 Tax=Streptomyces sp. 6-11-2 TaxID=2585753 RepID=UPI0011667799|nr:hypothetical protein [Streptomyces sp. 6-11-2]GED88529.1 hypothetical protein TNCT6_56140 [Streptomyces sp. 6-11-2]
MTRPATPTASEDRSAPVPFTQTPPAAIYEMRMLSTAAEHEEAAALVQDRQNWLAMHGLPVPARADIPAQFREAQTLSAGLFEDGRLLACMIPEHSPDLGWGQGPCLHLGCVHTLPGQSDDITRLITLWASDFAARLDLHVVRAETLARHALEAEPLAALLRRLTDTGWDVCGSGPGRDGDRVARLELPAELRPRAPPADQLPGPRASAGPG